MTYCRHQSIYIQNATCTPQYDSRFNICGTPRACRAATPQVSMDTRAPCARVSPLATHVVQKSATLSRRAQHVEDATPRMARVHVLVTTPEARAQTARAVLKAPNAPKSAIHSRRVRGMDDAILSTARVCV